MAIQADVEDILAYLSQRLNIHSYRSNIVGQQVKLLRHEIPVLVYRFPSSDWTILFPHYAVRGSGYFGSIHSLKLLPEISIRLGSATICWGTDVGCYFCYSFYENGTLRECLKFDSEKVKGYEDLDTSEEVQDTSELYGKGPEIETYFHHINVAENINQLAIGVNKSAELTFNFMKRHSLYAPDFELRRNAISDSIIRFNFETINRKDFEILDFCYINPNC
ncbi:MAG: hypothetical protein HC800_18905 [Phormidesmis sp. RL_2_1]|nr:hypothetical protein [Phormidesmis sp. RL_2_1]